MHTPFFCHLTLRLRFPLACLKIPFSMIRAAGKNWSGIESRMAIAYMNCTTCTNWLSAGKFTRTTVWTFEPYAAYASAPAPPNRTVTASAQDGIRRVAAAQVRKNITPVSATGNLSGSAMASVMGIMRPMPSNEKTAVPMRRAKSFGLNILISATPRAAMVPTSWLPMYT